MCNSVFFVIHSHLSLPWEGVLMFSLVIYWAQQTGVNSVNASITPCTFKIIIFVHILSSFRCLCHHSCYFHVVMAVNCCGSLFKWVLFLWPVSEEMTTVNQTSPAFCSYFYRPTKEKDCRNSQETPWLVKDTVGDGIPHQSPWSPGTCCAVHVLIAFPWGKFHVWIICPVMWFEF